MMPTTAGEVTEWPNVPVSKTGVGATSPRVRIPPSPLSCWLICHKCMLNQPLPL